MNKQSIFYLLLFTLIVHSQAFSFCGFYVSKADAKLFNKASQVIIVRDGNKNVITMSNDFYGDVKDFAMVVPVPTVLKENDIKVVDRYIFDKLDTYTGPRLVEYFDQNPCYSYSYDMKSVSNVQASSVMENCKLRRMRSRLFCNRSIASKALSSIWQAVVPNRRVTTARL